MDASIAIGLTGLVAGFAGTLATLYVARRGGTFRQRSLELRIGGHPLINGTTLSIVWGIPERPSALASLLLELKNPGDDTIDDIVIAVVLPRILGAFSDQERGKPNIELNVMRGIDPGTSCKAERVGARDLMHFTVKLLHHLSGMAIEIPLCFPAAMGRLKFTVPVTFKGGETANLQMHAQIAIPIEILLMARNRKTQHFTVELEVYAPRAFGFRSLASEWLV